MRIPNKSHFNGIFKGNVCLKNGRNNIPKAFNTEINAQKERTRVCVREKEEKIYRIEMKWKKRRSINKDTRTTIQNFGIWWQEKRFNYLTMYLILNTIATENENENVNARESGRASKIEKHRAREKVSMVRRRRRHLRHIHEFNYFFGNNTTANSVIDFFTCKWEEATPIEKMATDSFVFFCVCREKLTPH